MKVVLSALVILTAAFGMDVLPNILLSVSKRVNSEAMSLSLDKLSLVYVSVVKGR